MTNFRNLYLVSMTAKDYGAAARCLENLGKHTGAFEKHQTQKRPYTQEDTERLKKELQEKGFDFSRRNDVPLPSAN